MKKPVVKIDAAHCKSCQLCMIYCKQKCIRISRSINQLGYYPAEYTGAGCTGCLNCALVCPDTAIEVYREKD